MTWYEIFPQILNMSLTASVIICFVLLCRLLLKRAPKIYSYVLWSVVLFRLLCPVALSVPVSVLGIFDTPVVEQMKEGTDKKAVITSTVAYIPADIVHREYPEISLPTPVAGEIISDAINEKLPKGEEKLRADPMEAPVTIITYLWMAGILVLLTYVVVSYVKLRQKLLGSMKIQDNIYMADHIYGPFVLGIIRPKIYLPSGLEKKEQAYIVLHEQHHIRRGDPVFKMLAFLALCIHWFNPLVWIAFRLAEKDMEMSCDEAVIRKLGEKVRADYSASLLQLATGQRILFGSPLAFGEGEPAGRIRNLARFKRPRIVMTVVSSLLCAVGIIVCIFNPAESEDSLRMREHVEESGGTEVNGEDTYEAQEENTDKDINAAENAFAGMSALTYTFDWRKLEEIEDADAEEIYTILSEIRSGIIRSNGQMTEEHGDSVILRSETTDFWSTAGMEVWMETFAPELESNIFYVAALNRLENAGILPDGSEAYVSEGEASGNRVAFQDVDMDGQNELLLDIGGTCMADMGIYVYQYDESLHDLDNALKFRRELVVWFEQTFYSNGIVIAKWSHNHGYSDTDKFWPYDVYGYNAGTDEYIKMWNVDAWEKRRREVDYDGKAFPDSVDTDKDGMVYRICAEETGELTLLDGAEYTEWLEELLKEAEEIPILWKEIPR